MVAYNSLKESNNKFSTELANEILSEKFGFMCQYDRKTNANTVWSVIYHIKNKKIYRVEGNSSRKQFKDFIEQLEANKIQEECEKITNNEDLINEIKSMECLYKSFF